MVLSGNLRTSPAVPCPPQPRGCLCRLVLPPRALAQRHRVVLAWVSCWPRRLPWEAAKEQVFEGAGLGGTAELALSLQAARLRPGLAQAADAEAEPGHAKLARVTEEVRGDTLEQRGRAALGQQVPKGLGGLLGG